MPVSNQKHKSAGVNKKSGPKTVTKARKPATVDAKDLGGRPRIEIDMAQLVAAVEIQCTADECAALLSCSPDTIDRRVKEDGYEGFADFYKKHAHTGKASLRRMQWKSAQEGNVTMQIWLGKQMLDQTDKNTTQHDASPELKAFLESISGQPRLS